MNDYVIVTINGQDYYCPSNLVSFLSDTLVNTGSTTITLYSSIRSGNGTDYPYIICRSLSFPVLVTNYNQQTELQSPTVSFNNEALFKRTEPYFPLYNMFLFFVLSITVLLRRS